MKWGSGEERGIRKTFGRTRRSDTEEVRLQMLNKVTRQGDDVCRSAQQGADTRSVNCGAHWRTADVICCGRGRCGRGACSAGRAVRGACDVRAAHTVREEGRVARACFRLLCNENGSAWRGSGEVIHEWGMCDVDGCDWTGECLLLAGYHTGYIIHMMVACNMPIFGCFGAPFATVKGHGFGVQGVDRCRPLRAGGMLVGQHSTFVCLFALFDYCVERVARPGALSFLHLFA